MSDGADRRPNILLGMSDEHDPAVTGCYGHSRVQTPHIDALARDGTVFDGAYCNSPMCVPSRASFLTGQCAHAIDVWDNSCPLKNEIPTFANYFEAAGYDTILSGRMHMVGQDSFHGFSRRLLDDMYDWKSTDQRADRTPSARRGIASHVTESGAGSWQTYDETATDLAERFLESSAQYPSERPWLLVCGLMFPHFPLIAPQLLYDLYWPDNVDLPDMTREALTDQHPVIQHLRFFMHNDQDFPEELMRRAVASYYALVTLTDRNVGRLVDMVDRTPLRDNTIVI